MPSVNLSTWKLEIVKLERLNRSQTEIVRCGYRQASAATWQSARLKLYISMWCLLLSTIRAGYSQRKWLVVFTQI